jgi:hypothetical protein
MVYVLEKLIFPGHWVGRQDHRCVGVFSVVLVGKVFRRILFCCFERALNKLIQNTQEAGLGFG